MARISSFGTSFTALKTVSVTRLILADFCTDVTD